MEYQKWNFLSVVNMNTSISFSCSNWIINIKFFKGIASFQNLQPNKNYDIINTRWFGIKTTRTQNRRQAKAPRTYGWRATVKLEIKTGDLQKSNKNLWLASSGKTKILMTYKSQLPIGCNREVQRGFMENTTRQLTY